MRRRPLWTYSGRELADAFGAGAFTPLDVFESVTGQIDKLNPILNAFATVDHEGARRAAADSTQRWKEGRALGKLDGVPISVKDNIFVRGLRATWGSALYDDFVPETDDLPVRKLREAGVVILGKTNVPEFTIHGYTDNLLFGKTVNPWNPALTPGGSSGGAVCAVATGMGPIALATDGGGSIRRPASFTGLIGLKPSREWVDCAYGFPDVLSGLMVTGPIAREMDDLVSVMEVIAPRFEAPPSGAKADRPAAMRILVCVQPGQNAVSTDIQKAVKAAAATFSALGHRVEAGPLPFDLNDAASAFSAISRAGLGAFMRDFRGSESRLGAANQALLRLPALGEAEIAEAHECCRLVSKKMDEMLEAFDVVLTPSSAAMPWPADAEYPAFIEGQAVGPRGHAIFTGFVNMSGCPAINLPAGMSASGLPIGFQLIGRRGSDADLCRLGSQYLECGVPRPWPGCVELT